VYGFGVASDLQQRISASENGFVQVNADIQYSPYKKDSYLS
jgi:hypothetical protein